MSDIYEGLPPARDWTPQESKIYEVGYREGGLNELDDWQQALEGHLGLTVDGPMDAINQIKALLAGLSRSP